MRIVIKFGTNIIAGPNNTVNRPRLLEMIRQIATLHQDGYELALVSSGAIFVGRQKIAAPPSQKDIPFKQMLAAVGQARLMNIYEQLFDIYDITIGQALLTRGDLENRSRYLNARNTLDLMLESGVVPIINENDVVGVEEIKIGDNDNLSALIANLIDADRLIILTDQPGLFTADPRLNTDAELIGEVPAITDSIRALAGGSGTTIGVGGMSTKIEAAQLATRSGVETIIASGHIPNVLLRLIQQGESLGTRFPAKISHVESRKRWILAERALGELLVDDGAAEAITQHNKSLLPAGIMAVEGDFVRGATVIIKNQAGAVICRGVAGYKAEDLRAIQGRHSDKIEEILGYNYGPTAVHRDNMVILE